MKNKMFNNKGFTLIELIIVIALLGIVLEAIFFLFDFGNKTYASSSNKYDIQSSIRLANDFIQSQVRYATNVEISSDPVPDQSSIPQFVNYVYYNSSDKVIEYVNRYNKKTFKICPSDESSSSTSIKFTSPSPDYNELGTTISATYRGQSYNLGTNLMVMNLNMGTGIIAGTPSGSPPSINGNVLKFKTATNYMSSLLMPTVQHYITNELNNMVIQFDRNVLNVEILSYSSDVINPLVSFSNTNVTITNSNISAPTAGNITFRVTFEDLGLYGSIYDYTTEYTEADKWSIR
jgi:prepilin-type N-terminal cleavage/methylation domain